MSRGITVYTYARDFWDSGGLSGIRYTAKRTSSGWYPSTNAMTDKQSSKVQRLRIGKQILYDRIGLQVCEANGKHCLQYIAFQRKFIRAFINVDSTGSMINYEDCNS